MIASLLEEYIKKFDAFEALSEAEKKEQKELYLKKLFKKAGEK